jgi:hypothetical protein
MVLCTNILDYDQFENDLKACGCEDTLVTYYKSESTMGVSSKKRICIAIGAAYKPANAFDAITEDRRESDILKEEAIQCDTWQAWSRVKDPNSEEKSIVFALGVNETECKNIVTWGMKRELLIKIDSEKKCKNKNVTVNCEKEITKPKIVTVSKDANYLSLAYDWKQPIKKINLSSEKCDSFDTTSLILYYIRDSLSKLSQHSEVRLIFSESELLDQFINRYDSFAEQTHDGKGFFKVPATVTQQLLQNHADGKITIGAYTLNLDNNVRWFCYDVDAHENEEDTETTLKEKQIQAETDKDTICKFFADYSVPYILEASGTPYSYHIWVLVNPVSAAIAKDFAESILKFLDLDHEVFPKQTKLKSKQGYGNLVKLPLAINKKNGLKSKIYHKGEWITEIPEGGFPVQTIDIAEWEKHMQENKKEQRKFDKRIASRLKQEIKKGKVRPCINEALTKTLTGTQGHAMRVAIAREFCSVAKFPDEQIAELFKNQPDYDYEKSLEQVKSVTSVKLYPWKCLTLQNKCSNFVNCLGCKLRR